MSTNIHNERIKNEYISLRTFLKTEFKYLTSFFKKRKLPKLNEFPDINNV